MSGLFRVLLAIGVLVKFWWVFLLVLAVIAAGVWLWLWSLRLDERACAKRAERAELIARADQQNAWYLAGDPRGVYGDKGPPLYGAP